MSETTFIAGTYTPAHLWAFIMPYNDPYQLYQPGLMTAICCVLRSANHAVRYPLVGDTCGYNWL